jgi:hypothetical protein
MSDLTDEKDDVINTDWKAEEPRMFTTIAGKQFKIVPVSQIAINRLVMRRKIPTPPTTEVELLGGEKETVYHDAQSEKTPEEQAAWERYLIDSNIEERKFNNDFGKLIILLGTEVEVPDDNSDWFKEQKYLGFDDIPAFGTPERKVWYMLQSVLTDDRDLPYLVGDILSLGRVNLEEARLARDSFRHPKKREAIDETAEEKEQLDEQQPVHGIGYSAPLEIEPTGIPQSEPG